MLMDGKWLLNWLCLLEGEMNLAQCLVSFLFTVCYVSFWLAFAPVVSVFSQTTPQLVLLSLYVLFFAVLTFLGWTFSMEKLEVFCEGCQDRKCGKNKQTGDLEL